MRGGQTASAFGFGPSLSAPPPSRRAGGPVECWVVPASDVDAWLNRARPGETFIYCHGPQLVDGAAAARVRALVASGDVIPHNRRADDGGLDFFVRRNRVRKVVARAPVCDPHMMHVLLIVQSVAEQGERCPSDAQIGEAADISADQVKYALKKLEGAKMIARRTVPVAGDPKFRVIKVLATGAETASPTPGAKS